MRPPYNFAIRACYIPLNATAAGVVTPAAVDAWLISSAEYYYLYGWSAVIFVNTPCALPSIPVVT